MAADCFQMRSFGIRMSQNRRRLGLHRFTLHPLEKLTALLKDLTKLENPGKDIE